MALANSLLKRLEGRQLVQFRIGNGVHLELSADHEVTIETTLAVVDGGTRWSGEPLTAEAAGALLPLILREVTSVKILGDRTLSIGSARPSFRYLLTRCMRRGKFGAPRVY